MRALAYLEWRYLRHQVAAIVRSPLRLTVWIPYTLLLAYAIVVRFASPHAALPTSVRLDAHHMTGAAGAYLVALGIAILAAASGRVAAFRLPAEAVLCSNAGLAPLTIVLWLQIRRLAIAFPRYVGVIAYALVVLPHATDPGEAARSLVATLLLAAVTLGTELPVFLLARGRLQNVGRIAGVALAASGVWFAARGFVFADDASPLDGIGVDPGLLASAVIAGTLPAIFTLVALLALATLATAMLAGDALPEIYATTLAPLGNGSSSRAVGPQDGRPRVPRGALAMIWKDWIGFKRVRGNVWFLLVAGAFWLGCGLAAGVYDAQTRGSLVASLIGTSTVTIFVITPASAAATVATDLGKPLFWLSRSPLRARIAAWTFARTWRGATAIALGPLGAGAVAHDVRFALTVPIVFGAFWALQALGVGLYAVFPSAVDSRGPIVLLRLFVSVLFAAPATLVALGIAAWLANDVLAIAGAAVTLALQGWAVIELATLRLAERGTTFATIARST
ncbi:MAG: hypothetical protein NVS1B2_20440 [Vulcanimicrobiaceae bacterium]